MSNSDNHAISATAVASYLSDLLQQITVLARDGGFRQSAAYLELARLALSQPAAEELEIETRKAG